MRDFSPNEYLPKGVRVAGYFGDAADLPQEAFQEILDAVAAGRLAFPVDRVYDGLAQVPQAHDDMEHDRATGKLVVRVRHRYASLGWQAEPKHVVVSDGSGWPGAARRARHACCHR